MYGSTFSNATSVLSENFEAPESTEALDHILLSPAHPWDSQVEQTHEATPFHEYYGLELPPPAPKRPKIVFPGVPSSRESASAPRAPAAIRINDRSVNTIIKSDQPHYDAFEAQHVSGSSGAMSQFQHQLFDSFSSTEPSSTTTGRDSTPSTPAFEMSAWVPTTRSGRANRPPGRIHEAAPDQDVLLEARDPRAKRSPKSSNTSRVTPQPELSAVDLTDLTELLSPPSTPEYIDTAISSTSPPKARTQTQTPSTPKRTPTRPRRDWGLDPNNIEPENSPHRRRARPIVCHWSPEDDEKLKQLIAQSTTGGSTAHAGRSIAWNIISSRFGPTRTAAQCSERWMQFVAEETHEAAWTDVEDEILRGWDLKSDPNPWKQLASEMPGRTVRSLTKRYDLLASVGLVSPKPHKPRKRSRAPEPPPPLPAPAPAAQTSSQPPPRTAKAPHKSTVPEPSPLQPAQRPQPPQHEPPSFVEEPRPIPPQPPVQQPAPAAQVVAITEDDILL